MKKIFTLIAAMVAVLGLHATDYTAPMAIDVDGTMAPQGDVVISLESTEAGYDLTIRNFIFALGADDKMAIGNITAAGIEGTDEDGVITLDTSAKAKVTKGDLEGVSVWMGPILLYNGVDLTVALKADAESIEGKFSMYVIGQNIVVYVGQKTIDELSGITTVSNDDATVTAIYDITGKAVKSTEPGNLYILKYSNGRAVKYFAK